MSEQPRIPIEPGRRNRRRADTAEIFGCLLLVAAAGSWLTLLFGYWTGTILAILGVVCMYLQNEPER